jgi:RHS repeat-associated protein
VRPLLCDLTNTSATFYYHHDPLKSVTDVTNASGSAQWRYEYEAYGAQRSATDVSGTAPENRARFNGQYLDTETTAYHLRARQYDPVSGRFAGIDPVENSLTAAYDAAYLYASARATVLTDPLGLDPRLGNANINCARNAFLCVLIYNAGYRDGCSGECVKKAVRKLENRGIALDKIVAAANGKGKIVPTDDGPDGPGIYFVGGKNGPMLLEPPEDPSCGFICKIGHVATVALGCHSEASCIAMAATVFVAGGAVCRVGRAVVRAAKAGRAGSKVKKRDMARRMLADERGTLGGNPLPFRARTFENFNEAARHLQRYHGVRRADASRRLHAIKRAHGYGGKDNLLIDRTGNVYDPRSREWLGTLVKGG